MAKIDNVNCSSGTTGLFIMLRSVSVMAIIIFLLSTVVATADETLYSASLKAFATAAATADKDSWRFVFLSDSSGSDSKLQEILEAAARLKPLFILHGGDFTHHGGADEITRFLKIAESVKNLPPLFAVRGNHELDPALFEHMVGPRSFVLDSGRLGLRLVAFDNSDYAVNSAAMELLSAQLDASRTSQFVAMHIPPATARWSRHTMKKGKDELLELLAGRKVQMALFGHNHLYDADSYRGVTLITSGGAGSQLAWFGYTGEPVYHMIVVEVKKGRVSYRVERFETTLLPPGP